MLVVRIAFTVVAVAAPTKGLQIWKKQSVTDCSEPSSIECSGTPGRDEKSKKTKQSEHFGTETTEGTGIRAQLALFYKHLPFQGWYDVHIGRKEFVGQMIMYFFVGCFCSLSPFPEWGCSVWFGCAMCCCYSKEASFYKRSYLLCCYSIGAFPGLVMTIMHKSIDKEDSKEF